MKECDKQKSHISSKLHMIYISSNNIRHPITKTFTTLHPTTLHATSLHLLTLHFFKIFQEIATIEHKIHQSLLSVTLDPIHIKTS